LKTAVIGAASQPVIFSAFRGRDASSQRAVLSLLAGVYGVPNVTHLDCFGLINRKQTSLRPHCTQSLCTGEFAMASKFAIGDKVDQAFSNHAEGTVVAIFTDLAGEQRYAVEMFGHRTIQIASEGSLVAHGDLAL
jgi:hypothetical protein